jgi:D-beta-D-heptose 7-phosphate kinase/D-beta-D-heptose 1-phosphate adenosyltransferase
VILCSGCFDGLHAGHVAYLRQAAAVGPDDVVVAVACDDYIRDIKRREPRWTVAQRVQVVKALRWVSAVVVHGPRGVAHLIDELRPRWFVKASDWTGPALEAEGVTRAAAATGTQIIFVDVVDVPRCADVVWPGATP